MQYRKFKADKLFDGYRMQDDAVLVMTTDGFVKAVLPASEAGDDVEIYQGILSPGFINSHCHLELSHMKAAIEEGTGLVSFVTQVIRNRHSPEEQILEAIGKAEDEMYANGIVAVGDICNNILTLPQKLKGNIRYHNFIEASGFHPAVAEERFQRAVGIFEEYASQYSSSLGSNSIIPHAPYSVSEPLWKKIVDFPGNRLMTIHNQEAPAENELFSTAQGDFLHLYKTLGMDASFFKATGTTSILSYAHHFRNDQQWILVHNVCTTREDLESLQSTFPLSKISFCFCPNANRYISGQLPPVELFYDEKLNILLGTDSLASNRQLSILSEMKTIHDVFPALPLIELFKWATINGARALQMENMLGSFEKGKKPGVLLVNKDLSETKRML